MNHSSQSALDIWREKLEDYQRQLAIASDAEQKFQLKKLIQECQQKIKELSEIQDASTPPSNLEFRGSENFIGRQTQLEKLNELLERENRSAICALAGMGGVGKTELAVQYALQYGDNYPGGICWLQVRGADVRTQIVEYGQVYLSLKIPDNLELSQQVEYCWVNWQQGKR